MCGVCVAAILFGLCSVCDDDIFLSEVIRIMERRFTIFYSHMFFIDISLDYFSQ